MPLKKRANFFPKNATKKPDKTQPPMIDAQFKSQNMLLLIQSKLIYIPNTYLLTIIHTIMIILTTDIK